MDNVSKRHGIICAGNWIIDIIHEIEAWPNVHELSRIFNQAIGVGGGGANVAFTLSRFNTHVPVIPIGAVGDDDYGKHVLQACEQSGLSTAYMQTFANCSTAQTHVMSVQAESNTYIYYGGANDLITPEFYSDTFFQNSQAKYFYLGYLLLMEKLDAPFKDNETGGSDVLKRAKQAGLETFVDLVTSVRKDYAEVLAPSLRYIDYLVVNETEAARACNIGYPKETYAISDVMLHSARSLLDLGIQKAVVVHSPNQALFLAKDGEPIWAYSRKLNPESIVSPLGGGDAFCAGILYAMHQDWLPEQALALAHAAARASLKGMTATDAIPSIDELLEEMLLVD